MPKPEPGHVPVDSLDRDRAHPVTFRPEPAALAALAGEFALADLSGLVLAGEISADGARGWRFSGRLGAEIEQACVVTLEPVRTVLDEPVERRWLPAADLPAATEEADPAGPDLPDPLGETIDLGAVLHEALALAIDPYPRAPGAELGSRVFGPAGTEPLTDEAARPFAPLAALKARLGGDGG